MTKRQQGRQSVGRRNEVLQFVRDASGPVGVAEIAKRLGTHVNTARFHLKTLLDAGQIEQATSEPGAPGRPPQLYQPVPGMDPRGPRRYRMLAEVLTAGLAADTDPRQRALEAGRAWGRHHVESAATGAIEREPVGSVERLVGMLDDLGFAPEPLVGARPRQIRLRHCPFLELATTRSEIVCAIHLGLMQGAMTAWGSNVAADRLDAFVKPDLCVAHLARAGVS